MKVLGPTENFPTWGSGKSTENPKEILLRRPVEFDYRASIVLGKQTVGGHKLKLVCTRTQEKGTVTPNDIESDLPAGSGRDIGQQWPATGSGALNTTVLT